MQGGVAGKGREGGSRERSLEEETRREERAGKGEGGVLMLARSFPTLLHRYMSLSLALRYVLEALKKPPTTKMYLFGLSALDKFKTRLKDFSQYCASIASIPHFQQFPMHLKQVWPPGLHDVVMTSQANLY